jgi:hypothetical protein
MHRSKTIQIVSRWGMVIVTGYGLLAGLPAFAQMQGTVHAGKASIIGTGRHSIIGTGRHSIIGTGKASIIGTGRHSISKYHTN